MLFEVGRAILVAADPRVDVSDRVVPGVPAARRDAAGSDTPGSLRSAGRPASRATPPAASRSHRERCRLRVAGGDGNASSCEESAHALVSIVKIHPESELNVAWCVVYVRGSNLPKFALEAFTSGSASMTTLKGLNTSTRNCSLHLSRDIEVLLCCRIEREEARTVDGPDARSPELACGPCRAERSQSPERDRQLYRTTETPSRRGTVLSWSRSPSATRSARFPVAPVGLCPTPAVTVSAVPDCQVPIPDSCQPPNTPMVAGRGGAERFPAAKRQLVHVVPVKDALGWAAPDHSRSATTVQDRIARLVLRLKARANA